MIGTSFGYCQHYLVLREEIEGQGGAGGWFPYPENFFPALIVDLSTPMTGTSTLWARTVGKAMPGKMEASNGFGGQGQDGSSRVG